MFDRLIELLAQFGQWFLPFTVIDHFERGVVLRLGTYHRTLEPGFHWMWPFGIERAIADNVAWRTGTPGVQSLLTKDNKAISIRVVVTARITDIRTALLEVEGMDHAMMDSVSGAVAAYVSAHAWDEIIAEEAPNELAKACRRRAKTFGIEIDRVQLADLTPARAIRLLQDGPLAPPGSND